MTTPTRGISMKYILLIIPLLFIGCASEHNYKYDSIEQFLQEYTMQQYMESQEVQMMEVENENSLD